jgi:hypothetical protein
MSSPRTITKESLLYLLRKRLLKHHHSRQVPPELKTAIAECISMDQLLELLFSTDFHSSEAIVHAFEHRIDQLHPIHEPTFIAHKLQFHV